MYLKKLFFYFYFVIFKNYSLCIYFEFFSPPTACANTGSRIEGICYENPANRYIATTIRKNRIPYSMQLLVSPRDLAEVQHALSADIIDIKNPREGSLGANFPWVIRTIRGMTRKPLSAAIGDWNFRPGGAALAAYGAASAGADYVKVGLMFDGRERAGEFIAAVVKAVKDEFPEKRVVIAGYSDHRRLGSIDPLQLTPLAAKAGADVVMVDTGLKDGKSTFHFMDESSLSSFAAMNREHGLMTAIAGSLNFEHLAPLRRIGPDIIGVRGMVCGGDRDSSIQPELVKKALAMIR